MSQLTGRGAPRDDQERFNCMIGNGVVPENQTGRKSHSRTEPGDDDSNRLVGLYRRPGFRIRRAHQTAVAIFTSASAGLGITTTQFGILYTLAHMQELDQAGLAKLVGLDRSTTGLVLDLLERRGTVERLAHPTDRRRRMLALTEAGRKLFENTRQPAAEAVQTLFGSIGKTDAARFTDLMEDIVDAALDGSEAATNGPMRGLHRRPGFLIRRAHQIATGIFVRECRPFDVTPTRYGVLYALRHMPATDQATLAGLVRLDRSTTAMVVGLLEERGLVERRTDKADRRRRVLTLTIPGRHLLDEIAPSAQKAAERLIQPVAVDDRDFLLTTLDRIVAQQDNTKVYQEDDQ